MLLGDLGRVGFGLLALQTAIGDMTVGVSSGKAFFKRPFQPTIPINSASSCRHTRYADRWNYFWPPWSRQSHGGEFADASRLSALIMVFPARDKLKAMRIFPTSSSKVDADVSVLEPFLTSSPWPGNNEGFPSLPVPLPHGQGRKDLEVQKPPIVLRVDTSKGDIALR
jgi:hypothetical protein